MVQASHSPTSWRKSSYSRRAGCVKFAFVEWQKSSYSGKDGCVEVAFAPAAVAVRDSKNPAGGMLSFSPKAFRAFITATKAGTLNL
jgi:Domain of unknown function (DUF397)